MEIVLRVTEFVVYVSNMILFENAIMGKFFNHTFDIYIHFSNQPIFQLRLNVENGLSRIIRTSRRDQVSLLVIAPLSSARKKMFVRYILA